MALLLWVAPPTILRFYYCSVPIALLFYQEGSIPYIMWGNIPNPPILQAGAPYPIVVLGRAILLAPKQIIVGVGGAPKLIFLPGGRPPNSPCHRIVGPTPHII